MGDKDRIKHMEDANWKPSNQYWKDKAEKLQKDLTRTALDYLAAEGQAQENLQRALEAEKKTICVPIRHTLAVPRYEWLLLHLW
jgi:hypothetical protein